MFFTILFYVSVFFIGMGIWMIVETSLSKDNSMGMGAFLGAVTIALGLVFLLFSDIPDFKTPSNSENPHSSNVEAPSKAVEN